MAVTYTPPFYILFRGDVFDTLCLAPQGSGPSAGLVLTSLNANILNTAALWQYGSDQNLYQYNGGNAPTLCIGYVGQPDTHPQLQLVQPVAGDTTKQWVLVSNPAALIMNGYDTNFCMNDVGGKGNAGDQVSIYETPSPLTSNIEWAFAVYPNLPGQLAA
jgi:hypothetical protein